MRSMIDIVYRVRRWALSRLRWRTRGVKVMVFDGRGALLLIRNRYGNTRQWVLPGGGVRWREAPGAAAVREVREETGCGINALTFVAAFASNSEGKRDTVDLFRGTTADRPVHDGIEVAEARFFALDDLPASVSPATLRRIDERSGARAATGDW